MDCYVCRNNDQFDQLPPRERIAADSHWRVAHAFNTTLPGWLILVPRRHVTTIAELTDEEAAALGTWQVRLSRAMHEATGCVNFCASTMSATLCASPTASALLTLHIVATLVCADGKRARSVRYPHVDPLCSTIGMPRYLPT